MLRHHLAVVILGQGHNPSEQYSAPKIRTHQ
ncbi:Uncharacterised protein [Vibrio cholerae]|nr:Uncharacterised protein [Vibrio cholerae]